MVLNQDTDKLTRVLATEKGLMFYHHHEGCMVDTGDSDPMDNRVVDGVMLEFKENRDDAAYYIFTDMSGGEHEVKLLGLIGTDIKDTPDGKLSASIIMYKAKTASAVSVEMEEEPTIIGENVFEKKEGFENIESMYKDIFDWYLKTYREYFKEYFPKKGKTE